MSSKNDPYIPLSTMESVPTIPCEQYDKIDDFELDIRPPRRNTLTHCYHSKYFWFAICHCILIVLLVTFGLLVYNIFFREPPVSNDVGFMNLTTPELEITSTTILSTATTVPKVIPEPETFEIPCPDGYIFFNQTASCYKVHQTPKTFENAEQTCVSEHGHLVSIHSEQENLVVFGMFRTGMGESKENHGAWIGLHHENNSWGWTDGSFPDYKIWKDRDQPWDVHDEQKSHVFLYRYHIGWQVNGKYQKMFICKKPANGVVPYSSTHTHRPCKSGYTWFEHTGQCYKALPTPTVFNQANTTCGSEKARITSVHSEIENMFIVGISYRLREWPEVKVFPIWIGMEKNEEKWHDGTSVDFTNWRKKVEPKDYYYMDSAIDPTEGKWIKDWALGYVVCKKY